MIAERGDLKRQLTSIDYGAKQSRPRALMSVCVCAHARVYVYVQVYVRDSTRERLR